MFIVRKVRMRRNFGSSTVFNSFVSVLDFVLKVMPHAIVLTA